VIAGEAPLGPHDKTHRDTTPRRATYRAYSLSIVAWSPSYRNTYLQSSPAKIDKKGIPLPSFYSPSLNKLFKEVTDLDTN
jgi:hypothetical protein